MEERLEALRERARAHGVGGNEEEGVREAVAATTSALAALHAASALDPEAMKWTEDGDAAAVWEDATARARVSEGAAKRAVARAEAAVENAIEADERERQAREEAAVRRRALVPRGCSPTDWRHPLRALTRPVSSPWPRRCRASRPQPPHGD